MVGVVIQGRLHHGGSGGGCPPALVVRGQAGAEKCPFTILGRLAKSVCYIKRARLDENVGETLHDSKRQHTHCSMLECMPSAECDRTTRRLCHGAAEFSLGGHDSYQIAQ